MTSNSAKTVVRSAAIAVGTGLELLSNVAHFHYELGADTRDWYEHHDISAVLKSLGVRFLQSARASYQSPAQCRIHAEASVDRNAERITALAAKLKSDFQSMQG